jgi:hypothetical protein
MNIGKTKHVLIPNKLLSQLHSCTSILSFPADEISWEQLHWRVHRGAKSGQQAQTIAVDEQLIKKYIHVMTIGCLNHCVSETSCDNTLLYWRRGKGPTIDKKLPQVEHTTKRQEKNAFVTPLPVWLACYTPSFFFTSQCILEKPGRKD